MARNWPAGQFRGAIEPFGYLRGVIGLGKRTACALVAIVVVFNLAIAPAAGAAKPRLSIQVPAEVTSGARSVATGRVASFGRPGRVQLQERREGRWAPLAGAALRHGSFRIGFVLEDAGAASVRVALLGGGRTVGVSPTRQVQVRVAPAIPAPAPAPAPGASAPSPVPPTVTIGPGAESPPLVPPLEEPPVKETPPGEEPPGEEPPVEEPPAQTNVYWGAWVGPQFTGTPAPEDMTAVTEFEKLTKKPLSLMETFSGWASCLGNSPTCQPDVFFPKTQFEKMRSHGSIPLYSWASEGNGGVEEQSEFQLADIAAGHFDSYIRRWAEEAKAWGHPFFLRFDWEMNGNWFPWSESVDGNHTGEFVTAWRHVHNIFTQVGATNVSWVWCPYANPAGNLQSPASLYPGDAYVDWTCLDGYNKGTLAPTGKWRSLEYLIGPNYREITGTVAPSKPMILAEVASTEHGGSKSEWIEDMFDALPTVFPKVRGLLWFDYYDQGNDWPIESSTAATEAFAAGISDPRYLTNTFGATSSGPVPIP